MLRTYQCMNIMGKKCAKNVSIYVFELEKQAQCTAVFEPMTPLLWCLFSIVALQWLPHQETLRGQNNNSFLLTKVDMLLVFLPFARNAKCCVVKSKRRKKEEKENQKKVQHPTWVEPTTSWIWRRAYLTVLLQHRLKNKVFDVCRHSDKSI